MKNRVVYISLLIGFSFIFTSRSTAQLSRSQIIGSYIYNFGNNIIWKNDNYTEFHIVLISSNNKVIEELKKMASKQKIQNRRIKLSVLSEPDKTIIKQAQMVFITNDEISFYMPVFDEIEGKEILLISENFEDKSYVMLNLYDTQKGNLLFEINKPNIINQHLKLSDEILLMGGTEIDIAQIYLKSQHSLREMELKVKSLSQKSDSLQKEIEKSRLRVVKQQNLIINQSNNIKNQKLVLKRQIAEINKYKSEIGNFKISVRKMQESSRTNKIQLISQEKEIQESRIKISSSLTVLRHQMKKIDSINHEIEQKNKILKDKNAIIGKQKGTLKRQWVIIVSTLIFILLLLYAYYQNHKKSLLLQQQKEEINQINEELFTNNEELKATLEEVQLMQQRLVQAEKMASLGTLSAGIAHEINNPINFVYAGINSLLHDFEDIEPVIVEISKINSDSENIAEKLKYIEKLKKDNYFDEAYKAIPEIIKDIKLGADRTAEIIKGLRSFSRSDKGELKYYNIHEGIDISLLLLKNKYKNRIEITKEYDGELPEIKCYHSKINQVFLNIISNAIDAIAGQGKIWIKTQKKEHTIQINIKDTGIGMDAEVQNKLFDPFFTTKPVGRGTGLGLSISFGIISEHGGEISFVSELGKGTEFVITLPIG